MRAIPALVLLVACSAPSRSSPGDGADAGLGSGGPDAPSGGGGSDVFVYAHTADALYRIDPSSLAVTEVGSFIWPSGGTDTMTDIAIDKSGQMVGVSFTNVYQVDPATARTTLLAGSLARDYNGLSFVPASLLGQSGDDVLVGTDANDGTVYEIDPMTGASSAIGSMGGAYTSSGDLVAVDGFGIVQTVPGEGHGDVLVMLGSAAAAGTFAATPSPAPTSFTGIYGLAFWKGAVFGFTEAGDFVTIDPSTGVGALVSSHADISWNGAAVTTTAPVIQ